MVAAELVCGGRDHDLQVWDIATQSVKFQARNLKHDNLDMQVPIWITDARVRECTAQLPLGRECVSPRCSVFVLVQFLTGAEEPNLVTACTGNGHVRLYDVRAGRRPVKSECTQLCPTVVVVVVSAVLEALRVGCVAHSGL